MTNLHIFYSSDGTCGIFGKSSHHSIQNSSLGCYSLFFLAGVKQLVEEDNLEFIFKAMLCAGLIGLSFGI
jgi:hypothetical protein